MSISNQQQVKHVTSPQCFLQKQTDEMHPHTPQSCCLQVLSSLGFLSRHSQYLAMLAKSTCTRKYPVISKQCHPLLQGLWLLCQGPPGMPPMMMRPGMGPPGAMPPPGLGMPPPGMGVPQPMHLPGMPPRPGQLQAPPGYRPPQSKLNLMHTLSLSGILYVLCLLPVSQVCANKMYGSMVFTGECTKGQV